MRRPSIGLGLLIGSLVVISFAIKLSIRRDGEADLPRLAADIQARLAGSGFAPARPPAGGWLVAATRSGCRIAVADGDGGSTLAALRLDVPRARLLVGYRGRWQSGPVSPRSRIERLVQERIFAIGAVMPRHAVLDVAIEGACPAPGALFDGLETWPRARPPVVRDAEVD